MNIVIDTTKDNVLLGRKELCGSISFIGPTPSLETVQKELVASQKSKDELVVIKQVKGHYGSAKANLIVYVYADEQAKTRCEPKKKEKKAKK